ncbi:hypothetical protein FQN57_003924 [Myotisia sp. PD_48]|nr:hypothetical protein FQN57_003924 [Myotisia sp. PD_48]
MRIRRFEPADLRSASVVSVEALMEDILYALLNPKRKEYPDEFRAGFERRLRAESVTPGFVLYVAITDSKDEGEPNQVMGYAIWERRGQSPEAGGWKAENEGVWTVIKYMYHTLQNNMIDYFELDKSKDVRASVRFTEQSKGTFASPIFSEMWYLSLLVVDPRYQRRGVGKMLVQ